MLSEDDIVFDPNNIARIIHIVVFKMLKDFELHRRLMLKSFFISNNLNCHIFLSLMIETPQGLSKTSLAQEFKHLVSESDMILQYDLIVSSFIIVSVVILVKRGPFNLLSFSSHEVDFFRIKDLSLLIICKVLHEIFKSFSSSQRPDDFIVGIFFALISFVLWYLRTGLLLIQILLLLIRINLFICLLFL